MPIPPEAFAGNQPQLLFAASQVMANRVVDDAAPGNEITAGSISWTSQSLGRDLDPFVTYTIKTVRVEGAGSTAKAFTVDASVDSGVTWTTSVISATFGGNGDLETFLGFAGITGRDPRIRINVASVVNTDNFIFHGYQVELVKRGKV